MKAKWGVLVGAVVVLLLGSGLGWALAAEPRAVTEAPTAILGNAFTYQGYLTDDGDDPIDGVVCDLSFGLWDAESAGTQLGITQTVATAVESGYFDVTLNGGGQFGTDAFNGMGRFLGIAVQCPGDASPTSLGRAALNATPYALFAKGIPLAGSGVSPAAAHSDHHHDDDYQAVYKRTVVVSPVGGGGNAVHNGAALLAAMDAISGTATSTQRYLVKIEPGRYDILTHTLQMMPFVDVEGSGQAVTVLTGDGHDDFYDGTVVGATQCEIRGLSIENVGGDEYGIAIHIPTTTGFRMSDLRVRVSGGSMMNVGVQNTGTDTVVEDVSILLDDSDGGIGLYNLAHGADATVTVRDVVIEARGTGSANYTGLNNGGDGSGAYETKLTADSVSATLVSGSGYTYGLINTHAAEAVLTNCLLAASTGGVGRGIYVSANVAAGTVKVDHSKIIGADYAVEINGVSAHEVYVGASMLDGGTTAPLGGTITCVGTYDGDYANTNGYTACP